MSLPRPLAAIKDFIHFLKGLAFGLGCGQEHVDEGQAVEGGEDHVHFPVDVPEERGDGEGQNAVPCPVGSCGEGDGFGADLEGEDFCWVGPGGGTLG